MDKIIRLFDSSDVAAVIHYDQSTLYNRPHFKVLFRQGNAYEFDSGTDIYGYIADTFKLGYTYPNNPEEGGGFSRYYIDYSSVACVEYQYSEVSRVETLIFRLKCKGTIEIDCYRSTEKYFDNWCVILNVERRK